MAHFDLPLAQLDTYRSPHPEPADFDTFWEDTLKESEGFPRGATFEPLADSVYTNVDVFDVSFGGYRGERVRGWFLVPTNAPHKVPCLVKFLGYGGGRGFPAEHLLLPSCGFACLVMDTRGQGSVWAPGETPDEAGSGPQFPGFLTKGVQSRETYYYRRVFIDACHAVRAAATHPKVDASKIGVTGGSQGGALAIAAAALCPDLVKVVISDVPFLCHFRRAVTLADTMPFGEVAGYLKCHRGNPEQVFGVLDYFDCVNMAARVRARALFSVGLMDNICPPSTIYAAYNAVTGPKEMRVYPFNGHEGGGGVQDVERVRFASAALRS